MKQHQIKQRFIWSHQGINDTKTNKNTPRRKFQPRRRKKSYQDSHDRHYLMTSSVTWPHIRIISLKVIQSLQRKSHQHKKSGQDFKFTPRRTWPPWSNDIICPSGWPCGNMLRSAHIPLANEQGLLIGLSYQNVQTFNWESFFMFLSGSVAMYMKVRSVDYSLLTNDYQYLQYAWYSMTLFIHTWVS